MKKMDSQKITIPVLQGLSAAFDSISQQKLIQILQARFQTPKSIENSLHQIKKCTSDLRILLLTHQPEINDNKT